MTVSSLERVLAYVGSTGSTSISFILPGLFYWKISEPGVNQIVHKDDDDDEDEEAGGAGWGEGGWKEKWLRWGAMGLVIWGFAVMAVCLVLNIFLAGGASGH